MSCELIINASLPETRISLMENGEIQELLIERASEKGIVGNIYKGRVTRVLPGMQAAFVDIGLEKAAFLYVDDVYVHSEIWGEDEDQLAHENELPEGPGEILAEASGPVPVSPIIPVSDAAASSSAKAVAEPVVEPVAEEDEKRVEGDGPSLDSNYDSDRDASSHDEDDDEHEPEGNPVGMEADPDDQAPLEGTLAPSGESEGAEETVKVNVKVENSDKNNEATTSAAAEGGGEGEGAADSEEAAGAAGGGEGDGKRRHRRGRRGGRYRKRTTSQENTQPDPRLDYRKTYAIVANSYPESYREQMADQGTTASDRAGLVEENQAAAENAGASEEPSSRPEEQRQDSSQERRNSSSTGERQDHRGDFRAHRSRDRRIRQKTSSRPVKPQVNIQDLLKEGQEILVQVAKDPIATKGARLTCHISLPGRHLVCMPTIDHVGVSRRIEREDERRRLREFVERNRPKNLGFIVRTASGRQQSEKRIKQDIDYLTHLWNEIREKSSSATAPALVYEDLNSILRAIRDWVTEEIDKVIVDSRYHYSEILKFVSHFMPPIKNKVELYHGDIPIFDAYGISTELSRALERKVWLKSGGYIVIDQAEALVAIDVNTGRYVGKKNLEDTILKTNLEAVQEIAYQLRLRNCGGIIILDLIDMEKDENKQRVYRALEDALAKDRARPTIMKISDLGLVEMTRKRTRDTIVRTLCESCSYCEGKGFIKGKQTVAYEVMREIEREGIERDVGKILVQAHPDVIDILAIDERETLDQLERRYRKQIYLQSVTDFHPEQFEVTADKRDRSDRKQGHHRERPHHKMEENPSAAPVILPVIQPVILPQPLIQPVAQPVVIQPVAQAVIQPVVQPVIQPVAQPAAASAAEEEDRLAFLRAQAAQDAALARLGTGAGAGASSTSTRPSASGPSSHGDRLGSNRRPPRGRRSGSGKFRRMNDRNRGRGHPKYFGYGSHASGSIKPPMDVETSDGPEIGNGSVTGNVNESGNVNVDIMHDSPENNA